MNRFQKNKLFGSDARRKPSRELKISEFHHLSLQLRQALCVVVMYGWAHVAIVYLLVMNGISVFGDKKGLAYLQTLM